MWAGPQTPAPGPRSAAPSPWPLAPGPRPPVPGPAPGPRPGLAVAVPGAAWPVLLALGPAPCQAFVHLVALSRFIPLGGGARTFPVLLEQTQKVSVSGAQSLGPRESPAAPDPPRTAAARSGRARGRDGGRTWPECSVGPLARASTSVCTSLLHASLSRGGRRTSERKFCFQLFSVFRRSHVCLSGRSPAEEVRCSHPGQHVLKAQVSVTADVRRVFFKSCVTHSCDKAM